MSFKYLFIDHTAGRYNILEYQNVYIAMIPNNFTTWFRNPLGSNFKGRNQDVAQPFLGLIQSFIFNGQYLFELAKTEHIPDIKVFLIVSKYIV